MLKTLTDDIDSVIEDKKRNCSNKEFSKMTESKRTKSSYKSGFSTFEARIVFIQLRQIFTKAPIVYYFDIKCYI